MTTPVGSLLRAGRVDRRAPRDPEAVRRDHIVSIYRLMYAKVGNQPEAEDLTSQVFLGARPRLGPELSAGAAHRHLLAAAHTVLADHWRRRLGAQLTTLDQEVVGGDDTADDDELAARRRHRVDRLLAALPSDERSILELRFLSGCSIGKAAELMGTRVGKARALQHRALRRAAGVGGGETIANRAPSVMRGARDSQRGF